MNSPGDEANDYDAFAEAYAAETESNLFNAYYERPAVLGLAGDVDGRRVLDVGCGTGPLFEALRERGADVAGLDASSEMLRLARARLGDAAALHHADLEDPLPFDDASFDLAIASLVLHYLQDWSSPLRELRRVLAPAGRLIVSVDHPFQSQLQAGPDADYFALRPWHFHWVLRGQVARMSFWHRPLHAMFDAFDAAGFRLTSISEPPPDPRAHERFPHDVEALTTAPNFLFFVLERPPDNDDHISD